MARKLADKFFHRIRHNPLRFFVDKLRISFLKLRILTFPFSKDTNGIIAGPTGATARVRMKRRQLFKHR
jgi:hypothetical protein